MNDCTHLYDHRELNDAAHKHSQYLKGKVSHNNPAGDFEKRAEAAGLTAHGALAENVAPPGSPKAAFDMLMNSPGHRKNIMNRAYHLMGIGGETWGSVHEGSWVQMFAGGYTNGECLSATANYRPPPMKSETVKRKKEKRPKPVARPVPQEEAKQSPTSTPTYKKTTTTAITTTTATTTLASSTSAVSYETAYPDYELDYYAATTTSMGLFATPAPKPPMKCRRRPMKCKWRKPATALVPRY